jgi:hypothetical protein
LESIFVSGQLPLPTAYRPPPTGSIISPTHARGQAEKDGFIGELIDRQREKLQAKAIAAGELLYRERPKKLVQRLAAYWKDQARSE